MSLTWSPEVAMSKEEIDNFLNQKLVARVATLRKDGGIHITPLWYVWDGQHLYFVMGSGLRRRQHISNLQRDPRISVIIDRDVRPEAGSLQPGAQAVLIRGKVELSTDESLQVEYTRKLLRKYLGEAGDKYVDAALEDGKPGKNRVIVKVKPEKIIAWDFAKLPFTY